MRKIFHPLLFLVKKTNKVTLKDLNTFEERIKKVMEENLLKARKRESEHTERIAAAQAKKRSAVPYRKLTPIPEEPAEQASSDTDAPKKEGSRTPSPGRS